MALQPISLKWVIHPIKIEELPIFNFSVYYTKQNIKMWAETDEGWELVYNYDES